MTPTALPAPQLVAYSLYFIILPQHKPFSQPIIRVNQEFVAAGDVGCAFDFGDDGGVGAEMGGFDDAAGEAAADDTFNGNGFV